MKKTITTITMALVLAFSATFANAGIIVFNSAATPENCEAKETGIIVFGAKTGIIVFGAQQIASALTGIIVFGKEEAPAPCNVKPSPRKNGIIVF